MGGGPNQAIIPTRDGEGRNAVDMSSLSVPAQSGAALGQSPTDRADKRAGCADIEASILGALVALIIPRLVAGEPPTAPPPR